MTALTAFPRNERLMIQQVNQQYIHMIVLKVFGEREGHGCRKPCSASFTPCYVLVMCDTADTMYLYLSAV